MSPQEIERAEKALYDPIRKRNNREIFGCYAVMTNDEFKLNEELSARRMMNSCLIYDDDKAFYDDENHRWGEYSRDYFKWHSEAEMLEIWHNQKADFKARCKVYRNTGTDCDGLSYNSTEWRESA